MINSSCTWSITFYRIKIGQFFEILQLFKNGMSKNYLWNTYLTAVTAVHLPSWPDFNGLYKETFGITLCAGNALKQVVRKREFLASDLNFSPLKIIFVFYSNFWRVTQIDQKLGLLISCRLLFYRWDRKISDNLYLRHITSTITSENLMSEI